MSGPTLCLTLVLSCAGCGVAGQPMPPGPLPPRPPTVQRILSTADGLEIHGPKVHLDVDGIAIEEPVELRLFGGVGPWTGPPRARATGGAILLPKPSGDATGSLVAYRKGRASRPSAPFTLVWSQPPSPPTPVGFVDDAGLTRLIWPPLGEDVSEVVVLRNGRDVARLDATATVFSEPASPHPHRYQIVIYGPSFRSAPSPAVVVAHPSAP